MAETGEDVIQTTEQESPGMSLVSNALAIIGFVILAVVIVWGLFNIAAISKFSISNWFSPPPSVHITTPTDAHSGTPATISWNVSTGAPGTYAFLYSCSNYFMFATRGATGVLNRIPCGTAISAGSSTSATMIPVVSASSSVSVPLTVIFTPQDGSARIEGSARMTVAPASIQQAPISPAATPEKPRAVSSKPVVHRANGNGPLVAHAQSGPADLSVRIIATGYIDPGSGALLMNRNPEPGDVVGVEFDIANVGGSASGSWYFQAHLPTASSYTYTSPAQISLAPGAHIVNTLRFTQLAPGGGIFTVQADPSGAVNDADRTNNEASVTVY